MSVIIGLLLAAAVLGWRSADRAPGWIRSLEGSLTQEMTSGKINRNAFTEAAEKLQPLAGQGSLVPVSEGGTVLHLKSRSDAEASWPMPPPTWPGGTLGRSCRLPSGWSVKSPTRPPWRRTW